MELFNFKSNKVESVEDKYVGEAIQSGAYGFNRSSSIHIRSRLGEFGTMPAGEAQEALSDTESGFTYDSEEAREQRRLEEKYGTAPQQLLTAAEGVARTTTLSGSDVLIDALGGGEDANYRRKINPVAKNVGEFGGFFLDPLLGAGKAVKGISAAKKALKYTPLNRLEQAGKIAGSTVAKAVHGVTKSKHAAKIAGAGVRGGVEGVAFKAAQEISEHTIGDKPTNAELTMVDALKETGKAFLTGAAISGGFSVVGSAAEKSANKFRKSKIAIMDDIKKEAGLPKGENRIHVRGEALKKRQTQNELGQKSVLFEYDAKEMAYVYDDGLRRVLLDPTKIKGKVLDKMSKADFIEFNEKLGMETYHGDYEKFLEAIDKTTTTGKHQNILNYFKDKKVSENIVKVMGSYEGANKATSQLNNIKKGYQRLVNKKKVLTGQVKQKGKSLKSSQRLKDLNKKIGEHRKAFADKKNEVAKIHAINNNLKNQKAVEKQVKEALAEYSAIIDKDRIFVTKIDDIDDAIMDSMRVQKYEKGKRLTVSQEAGQKLSGRTQGEIKKAITSNINREIEYSNFLIDHIRPSSDRKFFNPKVKTDLDDFIENISETKFSSLEKVDGAKNAAQHYYDTAGIKSTITGLEIAKHIESKHISKLLSPRGVLIPGRQTEYNYYRKLADEYRAYNVVRDAEGAYVRQRPFDIDEAINLKKALDQTEGLDFTMPKAQARAKEAVKSTANYMRGRIVKDMRRFTDIDRITDLYEANNKLASFSIEALSTVNRRAAQKMSNNRLSLTGILAAGVGASVGGLPYAIGGLALRSLGQAYGTNAIALYADKVLKAQNQFATKLGSSVKGFLNSDSSRIQMLAISSGVKKTSKESYEESKKDLEEFNRNPEFVGEMFEKNNIVFSEMAPETFSIMQEKIFKSQQLLNSKFPKDPYMNDDFREFTPSDRDIAKFNRYKKAILSPMSFMDEMKHGYVSSESIEVMNTVYSAIFAAAKEEMMEQISGKKLSYSKRIQLNRIFNIQMDHYQRPENMEILNSLKDNQNEEEQQQGATPSKRIQPRENMLTPGQRMMGR